MASQRKGKRATRTQTPRVTNALDRIAKQPRRAPANLAGDTQTLIPVDPPPLKLARKRNQRNLNVVVQGRWKNLTSLVRRQAANTSLSRDQGSIRFFPFSLTVCSLYVFSFILIENRLNYCIILMCQIKMIVLARLTVNDFDSILETIP